MDFLPLRVWSPRPLRLRRRDDPFAMINVIACCACVLLFCKVACATNPQGPARPPPTPQEWTVYHARLGACFFLVSSIIGGVMVICGKMFLDSNLVKLEAFWGIFFIVSLVLLYLYCFEAGLFNKDLSTLYLTAILIIWISRLAYIARCLQHYLSQKYRAPAGLVLFSFGLVCECCGGLAFIFFSVNYFRYLYTRPDAKKARPKPAPVIKHVKPKPAPVIKHVKPFINTF